MVDESNGDVRGREQEKMTPLIPWVFFEKLTVTNPGVEGVEKRHKGGVVKKWGLFYGLTVFWGPKTFSAKFHTKIVSGFQKEVKRRRKNGQRRNKEGFLKHFKFLYNHEILCCLYQVTVPEEERHSSKYREET